MVAGMRHALQVVFLAGAALAGCGGEPAPDRGYRAVPQGGPQRGLQLLSRYQCGSCHAIPGAVSHSVGNAPPLDGFGRRSYIAGRIPNDARHLQQWLQKPQSLFPGTTMPDLGVTPEDARDIAAYLLSLS
jgi:cytochrome c